MLPEKNLRYGRQTALTRCPAANKPGRNPDKGKPDRTLLSQAACTGGQARIRNDRVAKTRHAAYSDYRSSQGHYETMVDPEYGYAGCGNWFVSDRDYNWAGKYDVNCITLDTYADAVRNPFHNQ